MVIVGKCCLVIDSQYILPLFTDESMVVLVLKGEIELLTIPEMRYAYTINTGDIFCKFYYNN